MNVVDLNRYRMRESAAVQLSRRGDDELWKIEPLETDRGRCCLVKMDRQEQVLGSLPPLYLRLRRQVGSFHLQTSDRLSSANPLWQEVS